MDTFIQGSEIILQATFYDADGIGRQSGNVSFALQYLSDGSTQFFWFDWVNQLWVSVRTSDCELNSLTDNPQAGFSFSESGAGGYIAVLSADFTMSFPSGIYKCEATISDSPQEKQNTLFELKPVTVKQNTPAYTGTGLSLQQITDEVCRRCFKDTPTFRSLVKRWVNEAQQKINCLSNGRWWWLEKSYYLEIPANTRQFNLPQDYFEMVDSSSVKDITNNITLKPVDHKEFESAKSNTAGQPDKFCVFTKSQSGDRTLNLDPVPDKPRMVFIDYYKVLADIENDQDISEIPYWYQYLLIEFAVMRGHEYRQQAEMAQLARANWVEGVAQLLIEADQQNGVQVKPKWRW